MRKFSQTNKNNYNNVAIEGKIYNHTLERKVSQKGADYINGDIEIAIDDEGLNIVKVVYGYTPKVRINKTSGEEYDDKMYASLASIIDNSSTVKANGFANATVVRVSGNFEKNDYVSKQTGEIVEQTRVRGGFINEGSRNGNGLKFKVIMLATGYTERESRDGSTYGVVGGYVFDYANNFLPVQFNISPKVEGGMDYFSGLDFPCIVDLEGTYVTTTVAAESETAFGVRVSSATFRSWEITSGGPTPYEYGDESAITEEDVKEGLNARAEHLAQVKAEYEERQNVSKAFGSATPASAYEPAASTPFKF